MLLCDRYIIAIKSHRDSCHNVEADPDVQPWQQYAVKRGDTHLGEHLTIWATSETYTSSNIQKEIISITGGQKEDHKTGHLGQVLYSYAGWDFRHFEQRGQRTTQFCRSRDKINPRKIRLT